MKFKMVLIVLILLGLPLLVSAHDDEACNRATLFNAWARATPAGAPNGAAFGLLANLSSETDVLVSVSTPAAEVVELHEMLVGEGDVMQMRLLANGIEISAQNYVELAPGGLHIMLINLTEPLVAGEMLDLVLNFEHLGEVAVAVPIVEMAEDIEMQAVAKMEWPEACAKIHVLGAWARAAGPGMPNSAAYGLLINLTESDDTLISATTTAAEVAELHEMLVGEDDVMQMRPVEDGIALPSGGTAWLKPGGLHVMLIGLMEELKLETTVELTLTFTNAEAITLTVPVQEPMEVPMMG